MIMFVVDNNNQLINHFSTNKGRRELKVLLIYNDLKIVNFDSVICIWNLCLKPSILLNMKFGVLVCALLMNSYPN